MLLSYTKYLIYDYLNTDQNNNPTFRFDGIEQEKKKKYKSIFPYPQ